MSPKLVAQKLLIKPGGTLWLTHPARVTLLEPLPENVRLVGGPDQAEVAIVFADDAASVRKSMQTNRNQLERTATIWIAYPKANKTDINRDSLWPNSACGRSARWPSTTCGRRCGSGCCAPARHRSPVDADRAVAGQAFYRVDGSFFGGSGKKPEVRAT